MDPWDPRAAGGGLAPAGGAPMAPGGVMPAGPAMGGVPGGTYKTRMCQMWEQGGACPYGDRCTFAHGAHELVGGGGGSPRTVSGRARATSLTPLRVVPTGTDARSYMRRRPCLRCRLLAWSSG